MTATRTLSEYEAKQVFKEAGIPVVTERHVTSADEAVAAADEIGYPVILKVDSHDVQHKTDIGAVQDAHNADEVRTRYQVIMDNVQAHVPDADISGVLVEEYLSGKELIIGVNQDPDFGHVIMFGLGGIFVEVLKDVHFRAIPITREDAATLIEEMKTKPLLDGVRGEPPADKERIIDTLLAVSDLVQDRPDIVELDINPLFVNEDGAVAADAVISLEADEQ